MSSARYKQTPFMLVWMQFSACDKVCVYHGFVNVDDLWILWIAIDPQWVLGVRFHVFTLWMMYWTINIWNEVMVSFVRNQTISKTIYSICMRVMSIYKLCQAKKMRIIQIHSSVLMISVFCDCIQERISAHTKQLFYFSKSFQTEPNANYFKPICVNSQSFRLWSAYSPTQFVSYNY